MNPADQAAQVVQRLRARDFTVNTDFVIAPRPWTFTPSGVLMHHTASTEGIGLEYERNDIRNLNTDQSDWPAPHVQWYVSQRGRIYLLTRGGANHAGTGAGLTKYGIPNNLGNQYLWGIECQDDGYDRDWPPQLWKAAHALAGELLRAMDKPTARVFRHKDYDTDSGKVDTRYALDAHREAIRHYLQGEPEMDQADREYVERVVENKIAAATPKIAKETAQETVRELLSHDLTPEVDDGSKSTVRRGFRRLLNLGGGETT